MNSERYFPSPGAARHPLPQGEREWEAQSRPNGLPSPLEGEGASRSEAGEGQYNRRHFEWRTELTPKLRGRARSMRTGATEAEALLWKVVRNRRLVGFKFRRQLTDNRDGVLEAIWHALHPAPHPPFGHPLPQGEREAGAQSRPNVLASPLEGEDASRSEAGERQCNNGVSP